MNRVKMDIAKQFLKETYAKHETLDEGLAGQIIEQLMSLVPLTMQEFNGVMHEMVKEREGYAGVQRWDTLAHLLTFQYVKTAIINGSSLCEISTDGFEAMEDFAIKQAQSAREKGACEHIQDVLDQTVVILRRIHRARNIMYDDLLKYHKLTRILLETHGNDDSIGFHSV